MGDSGTLETFAIMFGASTYRFRPDYDKPQFEASARAIEAYLKSADGLALHDSDILDLFNSDESVVEQLSAMSSFIDKRKGARAFVFYIGHGGFYAGSQFYVAARGLKKGYEPQTGFLGKAVADHLRSIPGNQGQLFLTMDCCFGASMLKEMMSQSVDDVVKVVVDKTLDDFASSGMALLAASPGDDVAKAASTHDLTLFTKCFLETLERGIRNGQPMLSLSEVTEETRRRIKLIDPDHFGLPQAHAPKYSTADLTRIPLFRNPAVNAARPSQAIFDPRWPRLSSMTLPEELFLLFCGVETGKVDVIIIEHGLGAAWTAEFVLAKRFSLGDDKRVRIVDQSPVGDAFYDAQLKRFVSYAKEGWLSVWAATDPNCADNVEEHLANAGIIGYTKSKTWFSRKQRYVSGLDKWDELRSRFMFATSSRMEMTERTAALAAIATCSSVPPNGITQSVWDKARANARDSSLGQTLYELVRQAFNDDIEARMNRIKSRPYR